MESSEWIVRCAVPTDLASILVVEQGCVEAPHWSEGVWSAVLSEGAVSEPNRVSYVAQDGGGIVGFVVVSCASDMAELECVAVAETRRRQGVGKALCAAAMDWARGAAAQEVELEVRASSVAALSLYRSLGFSERGMRRGYYRDPAEDAVLMSASL